ncbi:MAG: prolyl oligopeptidase family serine peptidase [Myxococcales bacterium]|nr:prolyl oligopeptidase family serine peptidase [Myxococcales bacterium]
MAALGLVLLLALIALARRRDPPRPGVLHRDQSLVHDGAERRYHLYEGPAAGARPLVVLLHGGGGNIDAHIGLGVARWPHQIWLDIADEEGLALVVPQGLKRHWNDCRSECTRCPEIDDLGFILALIDAIAERTPIDRTRVYVTGESNGGFMTERLIQEAPERFAAAGVVFALEPVTSECVRREVPTPIFFQLGTTDAAIPHAGGRSDSNIEVRSAAETIAYWRDLNGCAPTPTITALPDLDPGDHSSARREDYTCERAELSVLTLEGAGHVAPSVAVQVSALWEGIAGIQNHDVEGARLLWDFFRDKRRP